MLKAVKVRLDPTSRQARLLVGHVGASRSAYNTLLAYVKECVNTGQECNWSTYGLRKWWNAHKDTLAVNSVTGQPWWSLYSKGTYSYAAECLSLALKNWGSSKKGSRKG